MIVKTLLCVKQIVKQTTCLGVMATVVDPLHAVIHSLIIAFGILGMDFRVFPSLDAEDFHHG